jgi:hypothetical protein
MKVELEIASEKLKRIASKSRLTARDVKRLSEELKERIAKRHGLL